MIVNFVTVVIKMVIKKKDFVLNHQSIECKLLHKEEKKIKIWNFYTLPTKWDRAFWITGSNVLGINCPLGLNTVNWSAKLKIFHFFFLSVGWRIETFAFQKWLFIHIFAWKWSFVSFRANPTFMIQVISHIFFLFSFFFASAFLTVGIKKRIIDLFWIAWFNGACLVL